MSDPTTAGSTSGMTPLRRGLAGRLASLQMVGMLTTKGLKFCSAPTKPRAAATAAAEVPRFARMASPACNYFSCQFLFVIFEQEILCTLAHGLAAANRVLMSPPASVAASPGFPRFESAEMAGMGTCSWSKL